MRERGERKREREGGGGKKGEREERGRREEEGKGGVVERREVRIYKEKGRKNNNKRGITKMVYKGCHGNYATPTHRVTIPPTTTPTSGTK